MAIYRPHKSAKERKRSLLERKTKIKTDIKYMKKSKMVYLSPEERREYEEHNKRVGEGIKDDGSSKFLKQEYLDMLSQPYKDEKDFRIRKLESQLNTITNLLKNVGSTSTRRDKPNKGVDPMRAFEPYGARA
jgi:hypothetical protein